MNIVEMIQVIVDGKTVRDRIYGYEYRLNGDILERKLPDEDGFKQASLPGVNIRERAQKLLDEKVLIVEPMDPFSVIRIVESCIEIGPPSLGIRFSSADIWDIVEGEW